MASPFEDVLMLICCGSKVIATGETTGNAGGSCHVVGISSIDRVINVICTGRARQREEIGCKLRELSSELLGDRVQDLRAVVRIGSGLVGDVATIG